jgi:apolipoprotein D and lipocalin family protein
MYHSMDVSYHCVSSFVFIYTVFFSSAATENNYQIIDTDYTNFAIVYNCKPLPDEMSHQFYWLLSRTPVLTRDVQVNAKILDIKLKYIDENEVRKDDQSVAS